MKKDFLKISDFTQEELEEFILLAHEIKEKFIKKIPHKPLIDKTLGMIFDNPSTRTRISFEVGMLQLGGHAISLNINDLQFSRGETIHDTARVISRFLDGILIRTPSQDFVETLSKYSDIPVINGRKKDILKEYMLLILVMGIMLPIPGFMELFVLNFI
jgi:ornithine carbamoyltransferase